MPNGRRTHIPTLFVLPQGGLEVDHQFEQISQPEQIQGGLFCTEQRQLLDVSVFDVLCFVCSNVFATFGRSTICSDGQTIFMFCKKIGLWSGGCPIANRNPKNY
jgi:hypothetical protein